MFQAAVAPTLVSIAVTPANATNLVGATQQFTATGTYSDGSTQNITSQATWTSSKHGGGDHQCQRAGDSGFRGQHDDLGRRWRV